jgi:hypothetical protein
MRSLLLTLDGTDRTGLGAQAASFALLSIDGVGDQILADE